MASQETQQPSAFSVISDTAVSARDLLAEIGDIALDVATDSETIDAIPVVGWGKKLWDIRSRFQVKRLERNALAFLAAVAKQDRDRIVSTMERIASDDAYAYEFTDTVATLLIESEKPLKLELLGNLLVALSREELDLVEFESFAQVIHAASIPALLALPKFYADTKGASTVHSQSIAQESLLVSAGVCWRTGTKFSISEVGMKLFKFGFLGHVARQTDERT